MLPQNDGKLLKINQDQDEGAVQRPNAGKQNLRSDFLEKNTLQWRSNCTLRALRVKITLEAGNLF